MSDTTPVDVLLESGEIVRVAANSVVSPFCVGGAPAGCQARFAPAGPPGLVRVADGAVLTCLLATFSPDRSERSQPNVRCGRLGGLCQDAGQDRAVLDSMVATMANRGPDGTGTWLGPHAALGQRRLAVIDIEGGSQPMTATAAPGRPPVVLVHAGEVYNFRELRAELAGRGHRFATSSDTEVVLRAYLEWGESCVERLDGMFGFAIWDPARETLLLARDRLGIKPLYYVRRPDGVLFSSEPKGLFAHPSFRPEVDEQLLPVLLNPRLALPGETPLRGLRELSPGHLLRVDRDGCHEQRYWGLVSREHPDDLPATVRTVRELLAEAVRKQLVADVPVGTLLSGGLDSTALTALAARDHHGPLNTFAVDFAGDEQDFRPTALRPERDAPVRRPGRQAPRHRAPPRGA